VWIKWLIIKLTYIFAFWFLADMTYMLKVSKGLMWTECGCFSCSLLMLWRGTVNHELWLWRKCLTLNLSSLSGVLRNCFQLGGEHVRLFPTTSYGLHSRVLSYSCWYFNTLFAFLNNCVLKSHFAISKGTNSVPKQPSICLHHKHKQLRD
jgi:hypothetical protein